MRRGFFQLLFALLLVLTLPLWLLAQATVTVLDDFEAKTTIWQPGKAPTYQDSSAQTVALTAEHATKVTLAPPMAPARQYRPLDLTLTTDALVANPFDPAQIDLRVRFTSPTGKVFLIPAFWYQAFTPQLQPEGAPSWQVRFTPTEAGVWGAQAELTQPKLASKALTLTVAANTTARGFVRIHPENSRYFAFDNGDLYSNPIRFTKCDRL